MSQINNAQGAIKLDEIATNLEMSITETAKNEDALTVVEQLRKILADAHTKQNYMLFSNGRINWTGSQLRFDADGVANNMIYRLFMVDHPTTRTIDLIITGTTGSNTATTFNNIPIANNELIYLELNRNILLSSGGTVTIENAVTGGSLVSGKTLKKVLLSPTTGMPKLASPISSGNTDTLNIPIAFRNDNTSTQNIYFPAHGIRWPANTISTLGAVIVDQNLEYPNYFVQSKLELQQACANLPDGGTIVVYGNFSIDVPINIPNNVLILGRGRQIELNFISGGQLVMGNRSEIRNLSLVGSTGFTSGSMVLMNSTQSRIKDCRLRLQNTSGSASCVFVTGNRNQIESCLFENVSSSPFRDGINYNAGDNNTDIDCMFT